MESTQTLTSIPTGCYARIHRLDSEEQVSHRLRELGFCENAIVRLVINGEGSLICEVCNTRIGLNQSVAESIIVSVFE